MTLSDTQIKFLQWLGNGHIFEMCIEKGKSFGTTIGLHKFEGNFCKRTIERLKTEKLITAKNVRHLSLRYERYKLTNKGSALLKQVQIKKARGL